jgi:hypothetical protein
VNRIQVPIAALGLTAPVSMAFAADVDYDMQETLVLDGYVKSVDWAGRQLSFVFHSNDGYDADHSTPAPVLQVC